MIWFDILFCYRLNVGLGEGALEEEKNSPCLPPLSLSVNSRPVVFAAIYVGCSFIFFSDAVFCIYGRCGLELPMLRLRNCVPH